MGQGDDSPPSKHAQLWQTNGFRAERGRIGAAGSWWGLGGSFPRKQLASVTMGAISFVVVQVLPLVSLQLSTQLIRTSLDLVLGKKSFPGQILYTSHDSSGLMFTHFSFL